MYMKSKIRIMLLIAGIFLIALFFIISNKYNLPGALPHESENIPAIKFDAPIFTQPINSLGLDISTLSGYFSLAPDGSKILFNGMGTDDKVHTAVANLHTGEPEDLEGNLLSGWVDTDLVALTSGTDIVLHDFKTDKIYTIPSDGNMYQGSLSPDRKWYTYHTQEGLRLFNLDTQAVTVLSTSTYDGAYAWYTDSQHILGYRGTDENLFEAGKGKQLAVWDIETKTYQDLHVTLPIHTLKYVEWLVPDHIARVVAGYDDGAHDYIVNIDKNMVVDLGDTSGMLMGGIAIDQSLGLIAYVGPTYSISGDTKNSAKVYTFDGVIQKEVPFELSPDPNAYESRESVRILSDHELIYIKKSTNKDGVAMASIIKLDLTTQEEITLRAVDASVKQIAVLPDHTGWITADAKQFYIEKL
jgi:hypothetical protein